MLAHPWVVQRRVITDEIQENRHPARAELLANTIEIVPGADARIRRVLRDGIRGADNVLRLPSRQGAGVRACVGRQEGDASRFRAALPHAHEPNNVEAALSKDVPLGVRDVGELDETSETRGKLFKPRPGVDLVEMRMKAKCDGRKETRWLGRHTTERRLRIGIKSTRCVAVTWRQLHSHLPGDL